MAQQIAGDLITPGEMADDLKVKLSWLYRQTMQHGEKAIPRVKVGKYLRFNRDAVLNWLKDRQNGGNYNG